MTVGNSKHVKFTVAVTVIAVMALLSCFVIVACEREPAQPPQPVVTPGPAPQPPPPEPVTPPPPPPPPPEPVVTSEVRPPQPPPPAAARIYRIYEDENKPEEFVDLIEFTTGCKDKDLGDIFAGDQLVLNPMLLDEKKYPLSRVVSITFDKLGLVEVDIEGAGKLFQPAAYRDNTIVLKNPDETVQGILVICRALYGTKKDGSEWYLDLRKDAAKKFYKIEFVESSQ